MEKPNIVSREDWQEAREALLLEEKEATHALDALAARRRRLPMVAMGTGYRFDTPHGTQTLLDLFESRGQLVVYQFMDIGPDDYCPGCTDFSHSITSLHSLRNRGVTWTNVSNMPLTQIEEYKNRMGWTMPFVSSRQTSFSDDCGAGSGFGLSVFLRDGDEVYQTYFTRGRGVDRLRFDLNIFDLTAFGRQESWEDSPAGWPQRATHGW